MDAIFGRFLTNSRAAAGDISRRSAVAQVHSNPGAPATFLCEFRAPFLERRPGGTVGVHPGPVRAVIHFPDDYLRSCDPNLCYRVAAVLTPDLVHPNVRGPAVCLGSAFRPGTPLGLIVRELYEIFTYTNFSLVEAASLNPEACRLLRAHRHLIDELPREPLFPRGSSLRIKVSAP